MDTEVDLEQVKRHYQGINASLITNTVNLLLTLTVGVAAFAVNILITSKGPLGKPAAGWLMTAFGLLLAARESRTIGVPFKRL